MPELPDLELFSKNLTDIFAEDSLSDVKVYKPNKVNTSVSALMHALEGESLQKVKREGKELWFLFTNDRVVSMHLMLKGILEHVQNENDVKYPVFSLNFRKSGSLVLADPLGMANVTLDPPKPNSPDALDEKINFDFLKTNLEKRSSDVLKAFLINQKILRGIGNAYADEILWDARISPESKCGKLPDEAIKNLAHSIKKVLNGAVEELKKSTPNAISGEYREFLSVHNKAKTATPTGYEIKTKTVATKSTYYTDEQILYS